MARRKVEPQPVTRGLSARAAIGAIRVIESVLDSFEATAPYAVAALGGRAGIQARFDGMAVGESGDSIGFLGPVPRLTHGEWERLATEYVDQLNPYLRIEHPGKGVAQPDPRTGVEPSTHPVRGLGYGGAF